MYTGWQTSKIAALKMMKEQIYNSLLCQDSKLGPSRQQDNTLPSQRYKLSNILHTFLSCVMWLDGHLSTGLVFK
jgi:hypothetical protein